MDSIINSNNQYKQNRVQLMNSTNFNYFSHPFKITITFSELVKKYNHVNAGDRCIDKKESVAGRVQEKRIASKNLLFYTVFSNGTSLQYLVDKREYIDKDNFRIINNLICRGDIVGVHGFIGKSKKGELSIFPLEMKILSPCLHVIPKLAFGANDQGLLIRKRYFDMLANHDSLNVFKKRSQIIKNIRRFLDDLEFTEVTTPTLSSKWGGASALPFKTFHNDLKQTMYMRVAPELYLKKLVVGGLDRVYEIGQQFRNEAIDSTHNPEFTSLEFYMAYDDYYGLMKMCEDMLSNIITSVCGDNIIEYNNEKINFSTPYQIIDIVPELEKQIGIKFPSDLSSDKTNELLIKLCDQVGLEYTVKTSAKLFDKLIGYYIEPKCINPTFVINHPKIMSPLAREHRDNNQLSERFELFICGMEIANAYSELNNSFDQLNRFQDQLKQKANGDNEIQEIDVSFIDALEYGLPPTGGFGLGIDRLVMILTGKNNIKDVIAFPL